MEKNFVLNVIVEEFPLRFEIIMVVGSRQSICEIVICWIPPWMFLKNVGHVPWIQKCIVCKPTSVWQFSVWLGSSDDIEGKNYGSDH